VEVANVEGGASQSSPPRSVTRSSPASRLSPSVLGENAIDARGTHNDNDSITSIPSLAVTSNPQDHSKPSQYNEELTSVLFPILAIFRNRDYQNLNDTDSVPSVPNINPSTGSSIDIRNNGAATVRNSHRKEKKSPRSDSSTQSAPAAVQVPSSSGRDLEHHDGSSRNSTFTSWSRRGHRKNFSRVSELARRGVDVNCDDNSIGSSLGSVPEYDSVDTWTIDLGNLKRTNSATNVEQPTTGGSGNGEGSSYTSVYTMVPEWRETTITDGSGNGEDSSCTSVYTMVPEWRETTTTDGSGNSETSHNTQPKSPTTAAVQDQKLEQTEQTLQKSQARPEKAQAQLETTREQWIRQQVVVMAHDLNHQPLLDYLAGKGNKAINESDEQGKTALHHAVVQNKHDVVQWLLAHGAAIDNKDADGLTLLHWAAEKGHTAVAELLLAKGADIQAKSNLGGAPLHRAAEKGHTTVAELLIGC